MWQKNVQIKIRVQFYRFNRYYSSDGRYFILALCPRVLDKLFEKDVLWEYYDRVAKLEDQKLTLKKMILNTILVLVWKGILITLIRM